MSKEEILKDIDQVLSLLNKARCDLNRNSLPLSSAIVVTDNIVDDTSILDQFDGFESVRTVDSVSIVSISARIDIKLLSSRPYLKITTEMLNCQDISKALAEILCMNESCLMFETFGLNKLGESRLIMLLDIFLTSFDSRVRIILLIKREATPRTLHQYSEKEFHPDKLTDDRKRRKIDEISVNLQPDDASVSESSLQTEIFSLKQLNDSKDKKIIEIEQERDAWKKDAASLKQSLSEMKGKLNIYEQELENSQQKLTEQEEYVKKIDQQVKDVRSQLYEKEKSVMELKGLIHDESSRVDISTQTDPNGGLKVVVNEIMKCINDSKWTPFDAMHRRLKHLKVKCDFSIQDGVVKCEMEVLRGLEQFQMSASKFHGEGPSKKQAKNNAARFFITQLEANAADV